MDRKQTDAYFEFCYMHLALRGGCDTPGGVEYCRVRREWQEAGRPVNVTDFILTHANAGPDKPA